MRLVSLLIICLMSATSYGYFMDNFDGAGLDARWTEDNSPQNPAGSQFNFTTYAGNLGSTTNLQEAYHHIETTIDTTTNFVVDASVRCSQGGSVGAPHLAVYWDETHFVGLEAGIQGKVGRELYNGTAFTNTDSTKSSGGWDWFAMKIEFTATMVKFYIADWYDVPSYIPVYHPELDMPRASWMTSDALLIVGRGSGRPADGTNPDFDNDYPVLYGADGTLIDYVKYQPLSVDQCGDPGSIYFDADMNNNCYVDFSDYAEFLKQWLQCTDPSKVECDMFWR